MKVVLLEGPLAGETEPETTPLLIQGSTKVMTTKGKALRKRKWWQSGAEYDRRVEVWTSSKHDNPKHLQDDLEQLLNSRSAKDNPYNGTEGVESKYWTGTEAGLMGIPLFLGLIYATDGSQEKGNMDLPTSISAVKGIWDLPTSVSAMSLAAPVHPSPIFLTDIENL